MLVLNLPPCNVGLSNFEHLKGSLVESYKNSIVKLSQSEQLKNLSRFRVETHDTEEQGQSVIIKPLRRFVCGVDVTKQRSCMKSTMT